MEVYHKVKNIALPRGIRVSALYNLFCIKKMAQCNGISTKTDYRYEPVAELAVERSVSSLWHQGLRIE